MIIIINTYAILRETSIKTGGDENYPHVPMKDRRKAPLSVLWTCANKGYQQLRCLTRNQVVKATKA
jgi:hypothetical protein